MMSSENSTERPLVTFALFAYNQEKFVRDAVEGALAQTYSPLQIILSDDCSSDHTFEIMQEMVKDYAGSHTILLNRNEQNLGLGGHVNRMMKLAEGMFIVAAAGDDISLPERTERIVNVFMKNPQAMSVSSKAQIMDELGCLYPRFAVLDEHHLRGKAVLKRKYHCVGCSHAWSKNVFDAFGPLIPEIMNEDVAISVRSFLLGEVEYIDEVLMHYRMHSGSMTNRCSKATDLSAIERSEARKTSALRQQIVCLQHLCDFATHNKRVGCTEKVKKLTRKFVAELVKNIHRLELYSAYPKLPAFTLVKGALYLHTYRYIAIAITDKITSITGKTDA